MKQFGITETGDPVDVDGWEDRLLEANIIISKELSDVMIEKLIDNQNKIIFHHTVTGLGGSVFEPNVLSQGHEFEQARKLFEAGFPISHYVLRVDPIVPLHEKIIDRAFIVMGLWSHFDRDYDTVLRCRISMMDLYDHVRERFKNEKLVENFAPITEFANIPLNIPSNFTADDWAFEYVIKKLDEYKHLYEFECCAEPKLATVPWIDSCGCASEKDLRILGLDPSEYGRPENPQRKTCMCLAKKQILGVKPVRCEHKCLYCFWRD